METFTMVASARYLNLLVSLKSSASWYEEIRSYASDFSWGGTVDKNLPAKAGDTGLIPGWG